MKINFFVGILILFFVSLSWGEFVPQSKNPTPEPTSGSPPAPTSQAPLSRLKESLIYEGLSIAIQNKDLKMVKRGIELLPKFNPNYLDSKGVSLLALAEQTGNPELVDLIKLGSHGKIYAATNDGLSISTDGGNNFTNKTKAHGLGHNEVRGVFVDRRGIIYASTFGGLSISTDGGNSFINKTTAHGLGSNAVNRIWIQE